MVLYLLSLGEETSNDSIIIGSHHHCASYQVAGNSSSSYGHLLSKSCLPHTRGSTGNVAPRSFVSSLGCSTVPYRSSRLLPNAASRNPSGLGSVR
jgi:hypothetical protein